jgi:hypothetical protein
MYVSITNHGQKKSNRHTPAQTKKAKQKRKATDRRREELTGQQKRRKKQKKKSRKKFAYFFAIFPLIRFVFLVYNFTLNLFLFDFY